MNLLMCDHEKSLSLTVALLFDLYTKIKNLVLSVCPCHYRITIILIITHNFGSAHESFKRSPIQDDDYEISLEIQN